MLINKIGYEHTSSWVNCQDFGFENSDIKCLVDGCSEGKHSEVGAKLFCYLFSKNGSIEETFRVLISMFTTPQDIKDYLLFTILYIQETENKFIVNVCGDGYIIKQSFNDEIDYHYIDFSNKPPYYAYNFIPSDNLTDYKDGVKFLTFEFDKSDFKSIGIASDGISYIINSPLHDEFEKYLLSKKEISIKRLINRQHKEKDIREMVSLFSVDEIVKLKYETNIIYDFKDDVTIVM
jgi:hypothetical protein